LVIEASIFSGIQPGIDQEMFGVFFRSWANSFKARSANRDLETDYTRVEPMVRSIQRALTAAEAEYSGLDNRMRDVLARAAISFGNGSDEYLSREPTDTHFQNLFDSEILSGERRLEQLSHQVKNFKFLNAALMTRFPDFKLRSE
jgi:hypothetical protein